MENPQTLFPAGGQALSQTRLEGEQWGVPPEKEVRNWAGVSVSHLDIYCPVMKGKAEPGMNIIRPNWE